MIKQLFVRNVKKGFATNSSSYHSTITHYITLPKEVWVSFKNNESVEDKSELGYITAYSLIDDEQYVWTSLKQLDNFEYDVSDLKEGMVQIAITVPDSDDDWECKRDNLIKAWE